MNRALAVLVVALALPLASCRSGDGDDDAYRLRLDGRAVVGSGQRLDDGVHRLEVGQVVRITDGVATLGLPGSRSLELRAGERADDDSRLRVAAVPELIDGHALLLAGEDETARLRSATATVSLRGGAARIRRSTGVNVAVYEGVARMEVLGGAVDRTVRALRQVALTASGSFPRRPRPLVYDRDDLDPWDRRYLAAAVALGGQLQRASLTLSRRLATPVVPDADYFRSLVPDLRATAFGASLLAGHDASVGETVVGATIALGGPGSFARRWRAAFAFRQAGADWGLVALDQRAGRGRVVGILDGILDAVAASGPAILASAPGRGRRASSGPFPTGPGPAPPPEDGAAPAPPPEEEPAVPEVPDPESPFLPLPPPPTMPGLPGSSGPLAAPAGPLLA